MLKDIVSARATEDHKIHIRFEDGVEGEVDLAEIIRFEGVFAPLADPVEVRKVRVDSDLGTVCWPGGADLDPDVLYARISGQPISLERQRVIS